MARQAAREAKKLTLPQPTSGKYFLAFRDCVRHAASDGDLIDRAWIIANLAIASPSNAGITLKWFEAAGFVENGNLTDRGKALRNPESKEYRSATLDAIRSVLGTELYDQLLNGKPATASEDIARYFRVGKSAAGKALAGVRELGIASGNEELIGALGRPKRLSSVHSPDEIIKALELFNGGSGGIDGWIGTDTPKQVLERLGRLAAEPLTAVQFSELLAFSHEAPLSDGFFRFYWLSEPPHPVDLRAIPGYRAEWSSHYALYSLTQLQWGLYRFYVDALLFFGSIRTAYRTLRNRSYEDLCSIFAAHMQDPKALSERGAPLQIALIPQDDRYLISEMACKSYAPAFDEGVGLEGAMEEALAEHLKIAGPGLVSIGQLLRGDFVTRHYSNQQFQFQFAADELLDVQVNNREELKQRFGVIAAKFDRARATALENTNRYLSMVGDLDVYVATSMRDRSDFREMARLCDDVFGSDSLASYHVRYFDPTLSAAANHEDKGIIECLMVKTAKILIYTAGERDSWGKDAEAAMALSLGKPVIFYCNEKERERFYREVHPLSRLVDFATGVVVGAMITSERLDIPEIISRIFENRMVYRLEQKRDGYLVLTEEVTNSVVRLQTSDEMLRETFWNHYQDVEPRLA